MPNMDRMMIMDMPRVERPREKLMRYGPEKLSDAELLAIILRTGTKERGVLDLAGDILKKFGAESLKSQKFADLKGQPGIGPVKACELVACFELGRRFLHGKAYLQ